MGVTVYRTSGISSQAQSFHRMIFKDAAKNPKKRYLYLVPEQSTLQVERELVELHPKHVLGNIQVVNFTNLAQTVLDELEIPQTHLLDDVGKSMILRRICEEMKKELPTFGSNLSRQGFTEELKSAVNELAMSGIRTDRMEQVLQSIGGFTMLHRKLDDIYKVYCEFSRQLGEKYTTAEELLRVLARHTKESKWLKESAIILYGFSSFKKYQYDVLEMLIQDCRGMAVVVTMGEDRNKEMLYPMAQSTCRMLESLAQKNQIRFTYKSLPEGAENTAEEICHLEKYFLSSPVFAYQKEPVNVVLTAASDPVGEVQYVLRELMRLVREEGYRYRDIAVITGDLSVYASAVTLAFEKAKIPYFLDEKRKFAGNPLAELVEGVLEVLEENMSYAAIMGLLRNPLFPTDREQVDLLDNYLTASGISGRKRWTQEWTWTYRNMTEDCLKEINDLRMFICSLLEPLWEIWKDRLTKAENQQTLVKKRTVCVKEAIESLVVFLQAINAEKQLEEWTQRFEKQKDFIRQSEYQQAYQKAIDLFDQIVQLMGEEELRPQILIDTLHSGFEGIKVGFIPVTFDRVVVGDLIRTRITPKKVLFLIGANDKVLPKEVNAGGIFSDFDRETLKEVGMELLPTAREEAFFQQEYLYLMMTKPSQKLIVTYSENNREGKEIRPSYLVNMLLSLFPKLTVKKAKREFAGLNRLTGKEDGFELLIQGLRGYLDGEEQTWWKELYRYYLTEEDYKKRLASVTDALFYTFRAEKLDEEIAKKLFEADKENHVTRLEQYAGCAYAHFLTYGLKLQPRTEHVLKATDYGTVFHQAISGFFRKLKESGHDWRTLAASERTQMVEQSVKQVLEQYASPVFDSSARNRYAATRIARMTDRSVWALGEQWKEGDYEQTFCEFTFSEEKGNAIRLPLKDGLTLALQGRIDRIDIGKKDDCLYVKVIDYKTGQTQFDLNRVYHGLQLQLLLYLEAVLAMEKKHFPNYRIVPAGIYYYNLKDPIVEAMGKSEEEIEQVRLKELRMNGLTNSDSAVLNMIDKKGGEVVKGLERKKDGSLKASAMTATGEQFAMLQRYVKKKAKELAADMYEGEITPNPYEYGTSVNCEYCEYQTICSFELRTEGCFYRRLEKMKKDDIWQKIEKKDGQESEENKQ